MIAVVGSINMDLIARVHHLPVPGETVLASSLMQTPGGKGANQAVAAARAGASVAMIGQVGSNSRGTALVAALHAAGVSTQHVLTHPTLPTGLAMITVDERGENSIVVVPGANGALLPGDVDAAGDLIAHSSIVLLQLEIPLDTVARAARLGRESGALVLLNPAPARELDPSILRDVDLLVPNEEEVATLSGMGAPVNPSASARMLLDFGPRAVIVTLGARGADIVSGDGEEEIQAVPVEPIDTTGAGDAFVGNLAAALDHGLPLDEAANVATAAAAWSVQHPGAQSSMPTLEQTQTLLEGAKGA